MKLYLAVTPDKYELPLVVADNVLELSRKTGIGVNNIYSSITHGRGGGRRGMKFVRVDYGTEECEW